MLSLSSHSTERYLQRVPAVILAGLSLLLLVIAAFSLKWRLIHDAPLMTYLAFLMDRFGYVPYRDFFDMNMIGTYFVHWGVGRLFQFSDWGFRVADLLCLAGISYATWATLKRFSWRVAGFAAVTFALFYLGAGEIMSFQRDYLLLLPISIAVWLTLSGRPPRLLNTFLLGLLCSLAATIKPQAAIGFPLFLLFHLAGKQKRPLGRTAVLLLAASMGFLLPLAAFAVYLWRHQALADMVELATHYWPLYSTLTGRAETLVGWRRLYYLVTNYTFLIGIYNVWVLVAVVGIHRALSHPSAATETRRPVFILATLAFAYSLYTVIGGKFWLYHWLPFFYFIFLLSSFCFLEWANRPKGHLGYLPPLLYFLALALTIRPPAELIYQIWQGETPPPDQNRVAEIASYLQANLEPGELVQPLDSVHGILHAMLEARAEIATPFIYDFHFYHHVSNPYIQNLRRRFIYELEQSAPRFIIAETLPDDKAAGIDTTTEFTELQQLLQRDYLLALEGNGYIIYERRR